MNELASIANLISLEGKQAMVTGAAAGIGRAIAYRLAEAGAALDLVDIDVDSLASSGGTFHLSDVCENPCGGLVR